MEVAAATSTVLLQSHRKPVSTLNPPPLRRSALGLAVVRPMVDESKLMDDVSNRPVSAVSPLLRVEVEDNASGSESPQQNMLTPPPELEQEVDGVSPSGSNECPPPPPEKEDQSRKANGLKNGDERQRTRNRITRNREAEDPSEVVNNYVDDKDLKQPRRTCPPIGGNRQPFQLPKLELEKEKDKLRIHMVGPKTRTSLEIEDRLKPRRIASAISIGEEFQVGFPQYFAADYVPPRDNLDDISDRDELMWIDSSSIEREEEKDLDDAWSVIRRQYDGKIGLDTMMMSLMRNDYNIDLMLSNIEKELFETLPHPFEPLNVAQQREFEHHLRKSNKFKGEKVFRTFQEKFLKTYYVGEIVNYYYDTKRRGCFHQLYTRCTCRESLTAEEPVLTRVECSNCTSYIWEGGKPRVRSLCGICELYRARTGRDRVYAVPLTEPEQRLATSWRDLERLHGRTYTKEEFLEALEQDRRTNIKTNPGPAMEEIPAQLAKGRSAKVNLNQLYSMTEKFKPKPKTWCSMVKPWGNETRKRLMEGYTDQEKIAIVKAFHKLGNNVTAIAKEIPTVSEQSLALFFELYKDKYRLDKSANRQRKDTLAVHAQPSPGNVPVDRSASATPELPSRRKRTGSVDPEYSEGREAPPAKTTRRTRQSITGY